ncbi:MAG: ComEC family competence protein, partial [Planctomycetaceae bacterium]|nr:ComEC family competence protein [Planctomycetaceae bacterium]
MVFSEPVNPSSRRTRQPAVPLAVCFAVGIVLDRFVLHLTWWSWTFAACFAVGLALWGVRQSRTRWIVAALLAGGVCLGGMRHHAFWSLQSVDDVSQFVTLESRLIRLRGRVESPPLLKPKNSKPFQAVFEQSDTTILTLDCDALQDGTRFVPIKGKVQVRINGTAPELHVADTVEVFGWISRPSPPANPEDFPFDEYLKQQQIHCIVRVSQPDSVKKISTDNPSSWSRQVDELRSGAEGILHRHLSEQNANIAAALLLGIRSELPEDVRDSFAQSGMMHVLALSGLHVGILAVLVLLVCRLLRLSPGTAMVLMLLAVLGLAVVSGGRPPIVRATVFLGIVALGQLANRYSHPLNILALASLVILAWNPSDLFHVGTQLSFLAVMGILMTARWNIPILGYHQLAVDESQLDNQFSRFTFVIWEVLWRYWCFTFGLWLLTGPLIAARFHLVSPIGVLLNCFLIPLVTLVLWLGYLLLLVGSLLPTLAGLFAVPLDWGLTTLLTIVEWGAEVHLGHFDVSG